MRARLIVGSLTVACLAPGALARDAIRYLNDQRRCTAAFGGNGSGSTYQDRPLAFQNYQGGVTLQPSNSQETWLGASDQLSSMSGDGIALTGSAQASVTGTPDSNLYAQGLATLDIWFAFDAHTEYTLAGSVSETGDDLSGATITLTDEGGGVIESITSQPGQPSSFNRQGNLSPGNYHIVATILARARMPAGAPTAGSACSMLFSAAVQLEHGNSVMQFSDTQGRNGWFYGYWDRTSDPNGAYSSEEVTMFSPEAWTGTDWAMSQGSSPWTCLYSNTATPNGLNSGHEHWAVRRWISDFNGVAKVTGTIRKVNTGCGDGTINYIIADGAYILRQDLRPDDGVGTGYSVNVRVHVGSVLDFVTAPGANDACDRTRFTAHITPIAEPIMDAGLGFSGVQGLNGWSYGWYRPATDRTEPGYQPVDFRPLPGYAWTGVRWYRVEAPAPRTIISYSHACPNDNAQGTGGPYWVIRRWTSNYAGNARLTGTLQKVAVACGDGVRGVILKNGAAIWTGDLDANSAMGFAIDFIVSVHQGDLFDFAVQDRSDDGCDITRFTATMVPAP